MRNSQTYLLSRNQTQNLRFLLRQIYTVLALALFSLSQPLTAQETSSDIASQPKPPQDLFRQENLVAWCIVPFDSQKRTPLQRAEMLNELKISQLAYDYRAEHIPTFEQEIETLQSHHIQLTAWWFPMQLNEEAKGILSVLKKHKQSPQLWVMGGGAVEMNDSQANDFIASEVQRIRPIADAAKEIGSQVGLYNHGGWFGVPENMIRLKKAIDRDNVGIVYNLHHAHEELARIDQVLRILAPHLICLNINGMETDGEKKGKKILVVGEGDRDTKVLTAIRNSGYSGPIGILNHTDEDAKTRLMANIEGLRKLLDQSASQR